ncbi:hypothetical protein JW835_05465 [bacterium]|nr:hypothetical protein [bacterium]
MNPLQRIQEFIIRYFYHPLQLHRTINFTDTIKKVQSILVYCPEEPLINDIHQNLKKIFQNASIHYILPVEQSNDIHRITKAKHIHYLYKNSIYKSSKSDPCKTLLKKPIDLFIDLDREPNILNFFLCRMLQPVICLSYYKPFSKYYYNFQYRSNTYNPTPERFKNIYRILSSWKAGEPGTLR